MAEDHLDARIVTKANNIKGAMETFHRVTITGEKWNNYIYSEGTEYFYIVIQFMIKARKVISIDGYYKKMLCLK